MYLTLSQIEHRISQLAKIIQASPDMLPTFGYSEQSGRPQIEVDEKGYHYVVSERGHELKRLITSDLDELLYNVFQGVTFSLACKYELDHRIHGQDSRRIIFAWQEERLSELSPSWSERRKLGHHEILKQYPFDDDASCRADFSKALVDQGYSSEDAWKMACEKYPLPEESSGGGK